MLRHWQFTVQFWRESETARTSAFSGPKRAARDLRPERRVEHPSIATLLQRIQFHHTARDCIYGKKKTQLLQETEATILTPQNRRVPDMFD